MVDDRVELRSLLEAKELQIGQDVWAENITVGNHPIPALPKGLKLT